MSYIQHMYYFILEPFAMMMDQHSSEMDSSMEREKINYVTLFSPKMILFRALLLIYGCIWGNALKVRRCLLLQYWYSIALVDISITNVPRETRDSLKTGGLLKWWSAERPGPRGSSHRLRNTLWKDQLRKIIKSTQFILKSNKFSEKLV